MPKASAADAAVPEQPQPDPAPRPGGAAWPCWRYNGPVGRIYAAIPVTPQPGDVVAWPRIPADDGTWAPTDSPATRLPDNHRPHPADTPKEG